MNIGMVNLRQNTEIHHNKIEGHKRRSLCICICLMMPGKDSAIHVNVACKTYSDSILGEGIFYTWRMSQNAECLPINPSARCWPSGAGRRTCASWLAHAACSCSRLSAATASFWRYVTCRACISRCCRSAPLCRSSVYCVQNLSSCCLWLSRSWSSCRGKHGARL